MKFSLLGLSVLACTFQNVVAIGKWGQIDDPYCGDPNSPLPADPLRAAFSHDPIHPHDYCRTGFNQLYSSRPVCAVTQISGLGFCFNLEGSWSSPDADDISLSAQALRLACNSKFQDGMSAYMLNGIGQRSGQVFVFKNVSNADVCGKPDWNEVAIGPWAKDYIPDWTQYRDGWKWIAMNA